MCVSMIFKGCFLERRCILQLLPRKIYRQYGIPPSSNLRHEKGVFLCTKSLIDKINQANEIHEEPSTSSQTTDFTSHPMTSWTRPKPSYANDEATSNLVKTSYSSEPTPVYTENVSKEDQDNQTNQIHNNPTTSTPNRRSTVATSQPMTSITLPQSSYPANHDATSNLLKTSYSSESTPTYTGEILKEVTQTSQIHEETSPSTPNKQSSADVTSQPMTTWTKPQPSYAYDEATTNLMKTYNFSKSTSMYTEEITTEDADLWTSWGNSSYNFVNTSKLTWDEAKVECSSRREGAHLVFIESQEEDLFISDTLDSIPQPEIIASWWIGLTDRETEDVWKWYDIPESYNNWAPNEPNDGIFLGEDCASLSSLVNWRWVDLKCETWRLKFICEVEESV